MTVLAHSSAICTDTTTMAFCNMGVFCSKEDVSEDSQWGKKILIICNLPWRSDTRAPWMNTHSFQHFFSLESTRCIKGYSLKQNCGLFAICFEDLKPEWLSGVKTDFFSTLSFNQKLPGSIMRRWVVWRTGYMLLTADKHLYMLIRLEKTCWHVLHFKVLLFQSTVAA